MYIQGDQLISVLLAQDNAVAVQTSSGKCIAFVSPMEAISIVKSGRRFAGFGNLNRIRRLRPDTSGIGPIMPAVEMILHGRRQGWGRSSRRPNDDASRGVELAARRALRILIQSHE